MSATTDIQEKWQKLKATGLDLGAKESIEQDAGYGGRYQVYEKGRIYWHHTVGCFEVHGGILSRYLLTGGHHTNPLTGQRELGFPTSDETITADGYRPINYFEWGAIYWCYGGVRIYGEIFKKYQALEEVTGSLGYPISSIIKTGVSTIGYFELGCICLAPFLNSPLVINYHFPLMGNALLASPDDADPLNQQLYLNAIVSLFGKNAIEQSGIDIMNLVAGTFFQLQTVVPNGTASKIYPLSASGTFKAISTPFGGFNLFNFKGVFSLGVGERLTDRTLFNICFKTNNSRQVINPHCIYTKEDKANFGLMHATDFHISRRLEKIRSILNQKGLQEGVNEYVNWNDKFRDIIKYANHLYDIGVLDLILATGDLVDYIFEKNDNRKGGGNFAFFRDIILGKSPYGDTEIYPPNKNLMHEELRLPIFTTLGNHDYRVNSYEFYADVDAGDFGPIDLGPGGLGDHDISSYTGLNITENEVKELQNGSKLRLDMYRAANSLTADPSALFYYRKYINKNSNYVVKIGINKVIMMDSKWDLGILNVSAKDIVKVITGFTSENEKDLMDVNPDSVGFDDTEIRWVRSTLNDASIGGVVIMGVHSPIINPKGNEYPHYFRQTEHVIIDKELINGYLIRQDALNFSMNGGGINRDAPHPDWLRSKTLNFKKQDPSNLLDYGTSRGKINELIKLCLGQEVARPIDLILCGHVHKRVEYRFGWNDEEKCFEFYNDFYTENPNEYYTSIYNEQYLLNNLVSPPTILVKEKKLVRIFIREGEAINQKPKKVTDLRSDSYWREWWQLNVPPYNNTLNKTTDSRNWWQQHRPLMIQTAALGSGGNHRKDPSLNKEKPQPNFSGVRLLSIENNVIGKIRYLLMHDIRNNNFKLAWEPASHSKPKIDIVVGSINSST